MANKIVVTDIPAGGYVDVTSRYRTSRVLYYGDANTITFETYKRQPATVSKDDRFYLITSATEGRPDLVSQNAYGVSSYWWRLMEANGIYDIGDFKQGVTIRVPNSVF